MAENVKIFRWGEWDYWDAEIEYWPIIHLGLDHLDLQD